MQPSIENIENIPLKRKPRAVSTFLKKTFDLLNDSENCGCVKWAPNGIGFIVTNEELFSRIVLPKYFKHNNYSSFVRQLNMYNFHKIRQTNSQSYFHHQCFDRDNKNAMSQIKRKPQKKKRKDQLSDQENVQNDSINQIRHKKSVQQDGKQSIHGTTRTKVIGSEQRVSIKLLKDDQNYQQHVLIKSQKHSTRQMFSQTFYKCNEQLKPSDQNQQMKDVQYQNQNNQNLTSEKNILSIQDDDKLSINDQITDRIPRFNTKELFYPSTNNLFPFVGTIQPSTFSLFF